MPQPPNNRQPLIVGEVLFDQFPEGDKVLGGAPFNVAWNLQGFGLSPTMLTAIGKDEEGDQVRAAMERWGMTTRGLQVVEDRPTGKVLVEVNNGEPTFDILSDRAWDFIELPDWNFQEEFSLLYLGSLASRSPESRETILHLKRTSGLPIFVDINLRPPWFELTWLPQLLAEVTWLKLNLSELLMLADITEIAPSLRGDVGEDQAQRESAILAATHRLHELHGCEKFWITCGGDGAYLADGRGALMFAPAPPPEPLVDAVGGGDAFASIAIFGQHENWDDRHTMDRAVHFASQVCQMQGATCEDPDFYLLEGAAD